MRVEKWRSSQFKVRRQRQLLWLWQQQLLSFVWWLVSKIHRMSVFDIHNEKNRFFEQILKTNLHFFQFNKFFFAGFFKLWHFVLQFLGLCRIGFFLKNIILKKKKKIKFWYRKNSFSFSFETYNFFDKVVASFNRLLINFIPSQFLLFAKKYFKICFFFQFFSLIFNFFSSSPKKVSSFIGHVHSESCDAGGGPHWQFDSNGPVRNKYHCNCCLKIDF